MAVRTLDGVYIDLKDSRSIVGIELTNVPECRSVRSVDGYEISFTADDGNGGTCSGVVNVGVPPNIGANSGPAVNDVAVVDSTGGA